MVSRSSFLPMVSTQSMSMRDTSAGNPSREISRLPESFQALQMLLNRMIVILGEGKQQVNLLNEDVQGFDSLGF